MQKKLLAGLGLLVLSILEGPFSQAQTTVSTIPGVLPTTMEHQAAPGPSTLFTQVRRTGTDALSYTSTLPNDPRDGHTIQVMTWNEGSDVHVSWDFFDDMGAPGSDPNIRLLPDSRGSLRATSATNTGWTDPDPDIVMAYDPVTTELYANLVYIGANRRVQYVVYVWNPSAHRFDEVTRTQLGDSRFEHSSPNIDANHNGLTAVTWQQTVTTSINISVTSPSALFPSFTIPQTITFGRAVLAGGTITGGFRPCYLDPITGSYGIYVLNPPTGLFEQTLNPDVAISDGDAASAVISSVFVRHFVDGQGLFSIENKLAVVQTYYNQCRTDDGGDRNVVRLSRFDGAEWNYSFNGVIGTPRIAATSLGRTFQDRGTDVEVVIDRTETNCGPTQYEIRNYGKSRGAFRPDYTLISPAGNPTLIRSVEPSISYSVVVPNRDPSRVSAGYTIAWTGGNGYNQGEDDDIWAVSLADGVHSGNGTSGSASQPAGYNRVNRQGKGAQYSSSVAGRYLTGNLFGRSSTTDEPTKAEPIAAEPIGVTPGPNPNVFLFFDKQTQSLSYRRTGIAAGAGTAFRTAATTAPLVEAYPNPSESSVAVTLHLQKGEQLRKVEVHDALGRFVANLTDGTRAEGPLVWRPAPSVPSGLYTVRAETTKRTASITVMRK